MHTNQTVDFVRRKVNTMCSMRLKEPIKTVPTLPQHAEWTSCTHTQMGMMEAVMSLDQLVDESDPDVDFPNSFHAFQTAEGIRQVHPDKGR